MGAERSPARRTPPSAVAGSPRARCPRRPALRHPPPGSARRAVPGCEGTPPAAAQVGRHARPPDLPCCSRLPSPRAFGRGAAADRLPGVARRLPRLCPSEKSAFALAAREFPAVRSRRPLHCLQCNLLLLILAVGENSSSEQAAETSPVVLQNEDRRRQPGRRSLPGAKAPTGWRVPLPSALFSFLTLGRLKRLCQRAGPPLDTCLAKLPEGALC